MSDKAFIAEIKKMGRPLNYPPTKMFEYLTRVFLWMSEGYSFRGACGHENLPPSTVKRWMEELPDAMPDMSDGEREHFRNAIKDGYQAAHAAREAFLQNRLLNAKSSQGITAAIFALKCSAGGQEEWRETAPMVIDPDADGTTTVVLEFDAPEQIEETETG